jgi:Tetracyclin repressor-like, C-terminal domain
VESVDGLPRWIQRGALSGTTDRTLLAEVSCALLFSRLFVARRPFDTDFVDHLVDAVLMPFIDRQDNRP